MPLRNGRTFFRKDNMTPVFKNPRNEPCHEKPHRSLTARQRELLFTQDPPLKDANPYRKGGALYRPYPEDPQGNPVFFDPIAQEKVDEAFRLVSQETYKQLPKNPYPDLQQPKLPPHQLGD